MEGEMRLSLHPHRAQSRLKSGEPLHEIDPKCYGKCMQLQLGM